MRAAKHRLMVVTEDTIERYVTQFKEEPIRTRLQLFIVSRKLKPIKLAREASVSRQHFQRAREGRTELTRALMARITSAARRMTLEDVRAEDLFELTAETSGALTIASDRELLIRAAAVRTAEFIAAQNRVAAIARQRVANWKVALAKQPGGVTLPLIRVLLRIGSRQLDRHPERAHATYTLIHELTDSLDAAVSDDIKTMIRGLALLYRAYALRKMGRYSDAMTQLDNSERELEGTPACATELAQVWYERAAVLFKSGDLAGAERQAKRASTLFTVLGDAVRLARTQILHGGISYERGDVEAARTLWFGAIEPLRTVEDREALASLTSNIGAAEMLLGNVSESRTWLRRAQSMFNTLGARSEVIRTRWLMAKLRLLHEHRTEGLKLLRAVRADFLRENLPTEAGFVGLDIVEALLETNDAAEELVGTARAVVSAFENAGATPKMLQALWYLHEAVRKQAANADLVTEVRAYLEDAARGADVTFTPRERHITASESRSYSTE